MFKIMSGIQIRCIKLTLIHSTSVDFFDKFYVRPLVRIVQWADLICKGSRHSRLCESPISMGQIDVLIARQHRADVFLDEVNSLGLGE